MNVPFESEIFSLFEFKSAQKMWFLKEIVYCNAITLNFILMLFVLDKLWPKNVISNYRIDFSFCVNICIVPIYNFSLCTFLFWVSRNLFSNELNLPWNTKAKYKQNEVFVLKCGLKLSAFPLSLFHLIAKESAKQSKESLGSISY